MRCELDAVTGATAIRKAQRHSPSVVDQAK
jgi:hypothetical protein